MVKQNRNSAVHAQKAICRTFYSLLYTGIKFVSRVQIPVEASLEKNVYVKNKNMSLTDYLQIGYGNISDKTNCWAT